MVIVDDDRLQGQLLTEMLQRIEGISFNTTTTIHASEAIAIATKSAPNIVFTDIEMPELKQMISLLRYTSNNINQIAKRLNESGRAYDTDLAEILEKQERLWQLANDILMKLSRIQ